MEGGPGYPSTGTAPDYLAMIGPLHADHDLLVVDARGTGRSTADRLHGRCRPTTAAPRTDALPALVAGLRRPARPHLPARRRQLGARRRPVRHGERRARPGRRHRPARGSGQVDLYGDSYGTYFAQSFLSRYPQLLRSVTLDSAYEARDLDPWYLTTVHDRTDRVRRGLRAQPGLQRAGRRLGAWAPDRPARRSRCARTRSHGWTTGRRRRRRCTSRSTSARWSTWSTTRATTTRRTGRSTRPARAYLEHGDAAAAAAPVGPGPRLGRRRLLRTGRRATPTALYYAVACTDYPQLFDMTATPAGAAQQLRGGRGRAAGRARSRRSRPPSGCR